MSFSIIETDNNIICDGGMSTEICFAKYLAHKTNKVYGGWNNSIRMAYENCINDTLNFVVNSVNLVEKLPYEYNEDLSTAHYNCTLTHNNQIEYAIISPGFMSVPYLTEYMNCIYLPSQFLVGVNNMKDLEVMLLKAKQIGIKCYASVGYDACISHCFVAWIKLLEIPIHYINLLNRLNITKIICCGVFNTQFTTLGENIGRYYGNIKGHKHLAESDIYLMYINESYTHSRDKDDILFGDLISDFNHSLVSDRINYLNDWESGFDSILSFADKFNGTAYIFYANDTLPLYKLSYHLGKYFAFINNITIKGFVFNNYIITNPTYEINYGYLPVCYWQQNPDASLIIHDTIKDTILPSSEIWINFTHSDPITNIMNHFSDHKLFLICNSSPLIPELKDFINKFKPTQYPQFKKININALKLICKSSGVDYI